jgi:hypothetical protein
VTYTLAGAVNADDRLGNRRQTVSSASNNCLDMSEKNGGSILGTGIWRPIIFRTSRLNDR